MQTTYIIKDNKIYQVIGENEAVRINIINGVPKKGKETVEYKPAEDFPYAFFEIRAKFSYLFEQPLEIVEEAKEETVEEETTEEAAQEVETPVEEVKVKETKEEIVEEEKPNKSKNKNEE